MKIAILGYGLEGKSVEKYFKKRGAEIDIFKEFSPKLKLKPKIFIFTSKFSLYFTTKFTGKKINNKTKININKTAQSQIIFKIPLSHINKCLCALV